MPRWLYRLLSGRPELLLDVPAPKRKPGPAERERLHKLALERMREMRFQMRMPFK